MLHSNFEWDEFNVPKLANRKIAPNEAEEVICNRPVDLSLEMRLGEERVVQLGETNYGRILIVVSTILADTKVRVITAWPAKERFRRYFLSLKRSGNVGRIEEEDLRE
jgi:uncharacterized DUF497 family protein